MEQTKAIDTLFIKYYGDENGKILDLISMHEDKIKQFAEEFSKQKVDALIQVEKDKEGDAVEFIEWIHNEKWTHNNRKYYKGISNQQILSATELYKLFKQSKNSKDERKR